MKTSSKTLSARLTRRKDVYLYVRWGAFIFLFGCLTAILITLLTDVNDTAFMVAIGFGYIILMIILLVAAVLMVLAMRTFVRIVSRLSDRGDLNQSFYWAQVTFVVLLGVVWLSQGFFLAFHFKDTDSYDPIRYIVILDGIGFVVCLCSFLIMARILFKSSKVQRVYAGESDVLQSNMSLLAYLRY